ncbi:hypothetical protein [Ulvibacterium sp.]|uniref:hypothetical protein n=1 Tax=Ulvibacterium sp. TaxID=2665914 RepID=UPI00261C5953|nr:hypothetical protein [Ulvibacterium sp.]
MGIYEYNILPEEVQWNTLWRVGHFVANQKTKEADYQLYAIDKFFVEVILNPKTSKIESKNVFAHGHCMEKYVGRLEI